MAGHPDDPDDGRAGYGVLQHVGELLERLVVRLEKAFQAKKLETKKSAATPEIERDREEDDPGVVDGS